MLSRVLSRPPNSEVNASLALNSFSTGVAAAFDKRLLSLSAHGLWPLRYRFQTMGYGTAAANRFALNDFVFKIIYPRLVIAIWCIRCRHNDTIRVKFPFSTIKPKIEQLEAWLILSCHQRYFCVTNRCSSFAVSDRWWCYLYWSCKKTM